MNGKDFNPLLSLFYTYLSLEKEILKRVSKISNPFCFKCQTKCCEEKICRESVESPFLSSLIKFQNIQYDQKNGWMSPQGCRLDYGKPLVCYEFFCEQILINKNFQASNIQQTIKEFILIGNRAYGNTHLICVDNLSSISPKKIFKISYQIGKLMEKLANETVAPDRKYRPA
ncbi:MAG: hypothetical protein JRI62_04280 [Deltaproteobacteria bacterium]|nr:hypothetical protein [Deltaproteobacteria bacterium]